MESPFANIRKLLEDPRGFSLSRLKAEAENINLKDKKPVIDVALRSRMLHLLSLHSLEDAKVLLKMGVAAALANICSAPTPFLLFADVFKTKPISVCQELFGFMEETITTLKDVPLFASGRNTLLRMCNDLLRRLSKSQNTEFCGQIQLFLSRLFPLDEKSGLNLMSNFNLEKETPYNKTPEASAFKRQTSTENHAEDLEEGETTDNPVPMEVDANLYVKFWSLQEFFKMPTICYDKTKWAVFQNSADTVLEIFSSIKLLGSDESDMYCETNGNKFSKYLTSEKLLDLQLMDSGFRRSIMVQFLLVFQYLTTPSKFKTPEQVLSDEQVEWITRKRESVLRLLSIGHADRSPQSSDSCVSTIERILERENHWNRWKNEGCPSFVRPVEKSPVAPRKRRTNPLVDRTGNKIFRFGNRELDKLWNVCPDNLAACRDERRLFRPSLQTYFQDAILELDPAEKVAEEYRSVNKEEWCWRAMRFLSRRSPHFYINWNPPGRPVKDYLTVILTEKLQAEEDKKNSQSTEPTSAPPPSTVSATRDSDSSLTESSPAKQPRLTECAADSDDPSVSKSRRIQSTDAGNANLAPQAISRTSKKIHSSSKPSGGIDRSHGSARDPRQDVYDHEDSVVDEEDLSSRPEADADLAEDQDVIDRESSATLSDVNA
ncbi:hypothetical protein AHF37_01465 [Paragonimus kellicotti]|nr:hypothetical protein AHF37_01465 [Paragonimus kellicotti]